MWSISLYIVTFAQSIVSREISYWLHLVMVLWLKPVVSWRNRGPSVCAHIRLCCSAHASITFGSHNPLWDYINMLSLHELFLPHEIHYRCQFYNGVMVKDLRYRGKTEGLLWMRTQDFAAWRMPVPRSLVMIHCETTLMCYLPLTFPWNTFYVVLKRSSNICHFRWIKRAYHFHVWSYFFWSW